VRDPLNALQWDGDRLWILNQRKLPKSVEWIDAKDPATVVRAIETLAVRGAPAIGVAAAYGVALAALRKNATIRSVQKTIERLSQTRPTAYNLFAAINRMQFAVEKSVSLKPEKLLEEARRYHQEDQQSCLKMARAGLKLFAKNVT